MTSHPFFGTLTTSLAAHSEHLEQQNDLWKVLCEETGVLEISLPHQNSTAHATISSCTCTAHSFYTECSHILLARKVFGENPPVKDQTLNHQIPNDEHQIPESIEHNVDEQNPSLLKLKQIVEHLDETTPPDSVCKAIDTLYKVVFQPAAINVPRKTQPLHPYRRIIRINQSALARSTQDTFPRVQATCRQKEVLSSHMSDHTMAKRPKKASQIGKNDFKVVNTRTAIRRSSAPSVKDVVRRNEKQAEQVCFQGLIISKSADDHIKAILSQKPKHEMLLKVFTWDLVTQVRMMSPETLKSLSDDQLFDILHGYLMAS